jgi:hypothetical protein
VIPSNGLGQFAYLVLILIFGIIPLVSVMGHFISSIMAYSLIVKELRQNGKPAISIKQKDINIILLIYSILLIILGVFSIVMAVLGISILFIVIVGKHISNAAGVYKDGIFFGGMIRWEDISEWNNITYSEVNVKTKDGKIVKIDFGERIEEIIELLESKNCRRVIGTIT